MIIANDFGGIDNAIDFVLSKGFNLYVTGGVIGGMTSPQACLAICLQFHPHRTGVLTLRVSL